MKLHFSDLCVFADSTGFIDVSDDCVNVDVGVGSSDGLVEDADLSNIVKLSTHDVERRAKIRPGISKNLLKSSSSSMRALGS